MHTTVQPWNQAWIYGKGVPEIELSSKRDTKNGLTIVLQNRNNPQKFPQPITLALTSATNNQEFTLSQLPDSFQVTNADYDGSFIIPNSNGLAYAIFHAIKTELNSLIEPPALLIGTPGRIADHIRRNSFDTRSVRTLVLDEFDKSLELGFQDDMEFIIGSLQHLHKRILTSATQSDVVPEFTGIRDPSTLNFLEKESSILLTTMSNCLCYRTG